MQSRILLALLLTPGVLAGGVVETYVGTQSATQQPNETARSGPSAHGVTVEFISDDGRVYLTVGDESVIVEQDEFVQVGGASIYVQEVLHR